MKKLVFFDIDGTLLPDGEVKIKKEVVDSINEIKKECEVFICTGRSYAQAKPYIQELNLDSYITSNGQEVCYQGEIIYRKFFPRKERQELINTFKDYDLDWGWGNHEYMYLNPRDGIEELKDVLTNYGILHVKVKEINEDDECYQLYIFGDPDKVEDFFKKSKLSENIIYYNWSEFTSEFMIKGESKANGIKKVVEKIDVPSVTYAFGDGPNDVEMLDYVDHPVVMGNGHEVLKDGNKFITNDCDEDGIKCGLIHVGLIKGE